jgi:hypothetical protein
MRVGAAFLLAGILLSSAGIGQGLSDPWRDATDAASGVRFIPVELWSGSDWDGRRSLNMSAASLIFGTSEHKKITGPETWTDPHTGQPRQVYRRVNRDKVKLFVIRADGRGLGRVFDSRGERVCETGFKFPLGNWHQGQQRSLSFTCRRSDGSAFERVMSIEIEKIDFEFRGQPHSLRYRWVADGGDKRGLDVTYTYSPGRGNVEIKYSD